MKEFEKDFKGYDYIVIDNWIKYYTSGQINCPEVGRKRLKNGIMNRFWSGCTFYSMAN